ncbi:MAG: hypothetical protein ACYC96_08100 [Fimbriimonadaceae bacterium]
MASNEPSAKGGAESKEFGLLGFIHGNAPPGQERDDDRVPSYPHLVSREFLAFGLMFTTLLVMSFLFDAPLEELANPGKTPNPAKAPWYFLSLQELLHYSPPFIAGFVIPGILVLTMCTLPFFRGRFAIVPVGFLIAAIVVPLFDGLIWNVEHSLSPGFANATRIYGLPTIVLLIACALGIFKLALSPRFDNEQVVERFSRRAFLLFVFFLLILVMIGQFFRGPEWRWVWPWR